MNQSKCIEVDTTQGRETQWISQPETRPISQDQLVAEVKGIYAGLVMVESKCIEVDNAQSRESPSASPKLTGEQWQALIALHRTLLHEHHDFFLASQHPSATPALRRLATKYAMPARMWRHGIHSFLELLCHRLPDSHEHMLTFIYLAYSMMALLHETVPAFEDTWIECLGDLGRYRMAIEGDDIRDREVWTNVSRHWYTKASDKAPTTGRLYHHLAILARPNALQQLHYYVKSLCVPIPLRSATAHDIPFTANATELCGDFLKRLDGHIERTTRRWLESGYSTGIDLACSLLEYGDERNILIRSTSRHPRETDYGMEHDASGEDQKSKYEAAFSMAALTLPVVTKRWGDTNTLAFLHTILVFMAQSVAHLHIKGGVVSCVTVLLAAALTRACVVVYNTGGPLFPHERDRSSHILRDDLSDFPHEPHVRIRVRIPDKAPQPKLSRKAGQHQRRYFHRCGKYLRGGGVALQTT